MAEYNLHVEFKHKDSLVEFSMHSALIPFLIKYTSFSLLCRHIVLLRLASASAFALALASGLTLRHPLLDFFFGVHQNMIQLYRDHF